MHVIGGKTRQLVAKIHKKERGQTKTAACFIQRKKKIFMPAKKKISAEQVAKMSAIGCSITEIAEVLGVARVTISRRFQKEIEKGKAEGRAKLRHLQWQAASDGNITMMIWLGKQLLGQTDKQESSVRIDPPSVQDDYEEYLEWKAARDGGPVEKSAEPEN